MEGNLENMSPIDLQGRFHEMRRSVESFQYSRYKIQKVVSDLRERMDYRSHYLPKVISMGPIHHGKTDLQMGEQYKLIWAQRYIESTEENIEQLYKQVADKLDDLKSCFANNVLTTVSYTSGNFRNLDDKLTWMLFVDGCSLLYILDIDNDFEMEETTMKLVIRDVLLLENQLPFTLLKLLSWKDANNLIEKIKIFLDYNNVGGCPNKVYRMRFDPFFKYVTEAAVIDLFDGTAPTPTHLLDLLRTMLLPDSTHKNKGKTREKINNSVVRYMNTQELRSNGIRIKSNNKRSPIEISFSHGWLNGELRLPEIVLDDITISTFINLVAYEMCLDFQNDYGIGTFLSFINSLIRQPEDVKDLRSAGILISNYGTDEELVKLFRVLVTDVLSNADIYSDVFGEINKHIANKWKTNTACFLKYIRHPWTNFAVHATELAFALGVIQTWFTIHPAKF